MEITEILQVLEHTRSSVRATRAMLADREPTPDRLAILADFDREIRAFEEAAAILRQVPDQGPLTLEQLREMDGKPVWVTPAGFFALVIAKRGKRVELISNDGERVYADKEIELVGPVYACAPAHIGRGAWVSVEERIPNKGENVLVFATEKYTKGHKFVIDRLEEGEKEPIWMYTHGWFEVTHWMPLPEPPEKNTEAL